MSAILYLTRHLLNKEPLRHVYHTLVYPNIIYCSTICSTFPTSKIKQLITAQKRIIRTITGKTRHNHTNNLFLNMKLLKTSEINTYFSALLIYKCLNDFTDNLYFRYRRIERYSMRGADLLKHPAALSNQSQTSICITALKPGTSYHQILEQNQPCCLSSTVSKSSY